MNTQRNALPRWLLASALIALLLTGIAITGPGGVRAQDATPTAAEEEPTDETVTEADTESAAVTTAEAESETVSTADVDLAIGDELFVVDGPLNVRESSGLEADVLHQLLTGAGVEIIDGPEVEDGFTWYEIVDADEDTGWVAGEFLAYQITSIFAPGDEVVVVDGPLNLREDAGLDFDIMSQLPNGEAGTVVIGPVSADGYDWYRIELEDETGGWVAGAFLDDADDVNDPVNLDFVIGDAIRVAVDDMNFRAGAGLDAEILDTLDLDALFLIRDGPVEADGYTWFQVFNYYYGEGWVAGELMVLEPDGFPVEG